MNAPSPSSPKSFETPSTKTSEAWWPKSDVLRSVFREAIKEIEMLYPKRKESGAVDEPSPDTADDHSMEAERLLQASWGRIKETACVTGVTSGKGFADTDQQLLEQESVTRDPIERLDLFAKSMAQLVDRMERRLVVADRAGFVNFTSKGITPGINGYTVMNRFCRSIILVPEDYSIADILWRQLEKVLTAMECIKNMADQEKQEPTE